MKWVPRLPVPISLSLSLSLSRCPSLPPSRSLFGPYYNYKSMACCIPTPPRRAGILWDSPDCLDAPLGGCCPLVKMQMCIGVYIYIYTHTLTYIDTYRQSRVGMYTHIYKLHMCTYVCTYIYIYTHTCLQI